MMRQTEWSGLEGGGSAPLGQGRAIADDREEDVRHDNNSRTVVLRTRRNTTTDWRAVDDRDPDRRTKLSPRLLLPPSLSPSRVEYRHSNTADRHALCVWPRRRSQLNTPDTAARHTPAPTLDRSETATDTLRKPNHTLSPLFAPILCIISVVG